MKFTIIFSLTLLLAVTHLYAQKDTAIIPVDSNYFNIFNTEEILLDNFYEDSEDSKLLDDLDYLKRNPLDLNKVTQEELETIPFVNSFISKNIIETRIISSRWYDG